MRREGLAGGSGKIPSRGAIDSRKGRAMGRAKARKREKKTTETVSWKGGRTGFAPSLSAIITILPL
jgi:hypothetical protein